jgi:hypothetical protein
MTARLTCPACGATSIEDVPTDRCVFFFECPACAAILRPKPGDCCVFCSYADVRCQSKQTAPSHAERPLGPEELWDRFIDALDLAGQGGSPADVLVPIFATSGLGGKRFGDLSREDVKALARVASGLARRGDTVVMIWDDMRRQARASLKAPKADR